MFTVFSKRDGKSYSHHVKPLQVIWNHFPQLCVVSLRRRSPLLTGIPTSNAKNTIHVDDLVSSILSLRGYEPQSSFRVVILP